MEDRLTGTIREILAFHRVPPPLAESLAKAAENFDADSPVARLVGALDIHFRFDRIPALYESGTVVLMGPVGSGKTVAAAKIAAACLLAGKPVRLVNADTDRAGGGARLSALAECLKTPISEACDSDSLKHSIVVPRLDMVVVDTPGLNPFDRDDLLDWHTLMDDVQATRILVLAAGGDAEEMIDQAHAFAGLGAGMLFATRLDATMRYGGILAAADAVCLPFIGAGIRPQIGDGPTTLNPVSLARLLTARHQDASARRKRLEKAA